MKSIRKAALACITGAMLVAMSMNATAQTGPRNQDTFFTFSQSVELPNKTLPAGTYFFQLMDSDSNRHIVKVMSQDKKDLLATLLAIPYYSNDRPSDDPQVRFLETPAQASNGTAAGTNAIKIWFYPGNSVGHEFIYPRSQAMRIAARTGQSVLTTKTDVEVSADSELSRVDSAGVDAEASVQAQAPAVATEQTQVATETTTTAQVTEQPAPATETTQREQVGAITGGQTQPERTPDTSRTERRDLPHTAGVLPLLALMGLGSLVGSRLVKKAQ